MKKRGGDFMTKEELQEELKGLRKEYHHFQEMELQLDMSRGKPCREQRFLRFYLSGNPAPIPDRRTDQSMIFSP